MIPRRRGQGQGFGLMLLAMQVMNMGVENIPPVTLVTVAAQVAIFLQVGDLGQWFPSTNNVCISAFRVLERKEWQTLILGALFHADDIHLYYNMASMLWKGRNLERKFKSVYFAYLLAVFTVLTSVMYVGLNSVASHLLHDRWYSMTCAVGFSGVLFALKVLVSHYSDPGINLVFGFIPVSSKIVYWAELVLIQLITPNASFTGHLAGILVGLMYIKGPLKMVMDSFLAPVYDINQENDTKMCEKDYEPRFRYTAETSGYTDTNTGGRRYNYSGQSGFSSTPSAPYPPPNDYDRYTGGLDEEEQLRRATEESLRQNQNTNRLYPDLDNLRERRQQRFQ